MAMASQGVASSQIALHTHRSARTVERRRAALRDRIEAERARIAEDLTSSFVAASGHALGFTLQMMMTDTLPVHVRLAAATQILRTTAAVLARAQPATASSAAVAWDDGATREAFLRRFDEIHALMGLDDSPDATVIDLPARPALEA